MTLGDNFPNLPVPMNSRRVCLGLKDMDEQVVYRHVVWLHMAEKMTLEEISERIVLSLKLLNGMEMVQLREAVNGSDVRVYWTVEE